MSPLIIVGTKNFQLLPLSKDVESPSKHPKSTFYEGQPGGIAFGNTGTCNSVRFGHSRDIPTDPNLDRTLPSPGDRNGAAITDLLGSIIVALVLRLFRKGSDEAESGAPVELADKSAITLDASFDVNSPFRPSNTRSREGQATPQSDVQSGSGNPLGVNVKSTGAATHPSAADPNRPPEAMPMDLWKDCVHACDRQGGDPFILAAQLKQETRWGTDNGNAADGVAQVEGSTRDAYAAKFRDSTGHAYNHSSRSDQIELAQLIKVSKGGDERNQLIKYNGGDNWTPGVTDSLGRAIHADTYADQVLAFAKELRRSAS